MEVDEFDVDKGDLISCPECGSNLEVTSLLPLELEVADDEEDDDEEEDEDADEEEAEVVEEEEADDEKEDWDE